MRIRAGGRWVVGRGSGVEGGVQATRDTVSSNTNARYIQAVMPLFCAMMVAKPMKNKYSINMFSSIGVESW